MLTDKAFKRWREKPARQVGSRRLELSLPTCAFSHRNLLAGSSRATFSMWCCKMGGTSLGGPCSEMIPADRDQENTRLPRADTQAHISSTGLSFLLPTQPCLGVSILERPGSCSHRLVGFPFCTLKAILRVHLMYIYGGPVIKRNSGTNK